MIRKRISSKFSLGVAIFGMVVFLSSFLLGISSIISATSDAQIWIFTGMTAFHFGIFCFYMMLVLNRCACVVWIDRERKRIGRRGLLWGFRMQVDVADIQKVVIHQEPKGGNYFYVVDRKQRHFDGYRKKFVYPLAGQ